MTEPTATAGEPGEYTLTVSEAAEMFGVSPATIRRWVDDGKLPSRKTLGGQRRFRPADLEALR